MLHGNVLVLNQSYQPINVTSVERAFVLVFLDKAELLHDIPDKKLRSAQEQFPFPSVIRLFKYVHIPYQSISLNRINIFRRDSFKCGYCGDKNNLTIDHVLPRSRGGKDTWQNLVTACESCNSKKGDRTPDEANMPLRVSPFKPSYIIFLRNFAGKIPIDWDKYLQRG